VALPRLLFHFSKHDIFLALNKYFQVDIAYILTSTHYCDLNRPTGESRVLNLQLPPFSLGKPIRLRRRTPCLGNNPRAARCTRNFQLNERQAKERCSGFKRGATRETTAAIRSGTSPLVRYCDAAGLPPASGGQRG
jgi:hypothetical protein